MSAADRVAELTATFTASSLDVAHLLCDRHPTDRVAFTVVDGDGRASTLTFGELAADSHRYARALQGLGVGPGDRVATLMGKSTDLVTVILAIWRLGAVYVPLFTAFAPQAIALRLEGAGAHVVVVDPDQRHKLDPGPDMPDDPQRRVVVTGTGASRGEPGAGDLSLADLVAATSPEPVSTVTTSGDGPLVHMFTSGTTGKPKGVIHPVSYIAGWQIYLEYGLGVTPDSSYWCAADPGWAYGLYSAIVAPLAAGVPSLLLSGGFSPETTWRTLLDHRVTDFTAAPTVYRGLRSSSVPVPQGLRLERASSAGEPLTPEVNEWAATTLDLSVHDHFGQTEVGMPLANHHHPELARPLKTGSMGRPVPGWSLTVLADDKDEPAEPDVLGRVAIDVAASPLMTFRDYQIPGQSASKFTSDGRYYLTGDAGRVDADGDFFFSSRDDDVIIMAGYRIGPFEIESVLAQHPAVAECSVIGAPDDVRGEVIEAYVVLRDGVDATPELATELQQLVKTRYAAHAYPRTIHFIDALPKTPSGKIQRYVLRNRRRTELTTPEPR
ncbi:MULTISPECIES: AMP-binding protein [unclassified Streptomyces]|uniref:AMP-binding protein n=1 Tax=unclassified Streptomyces TaxID=2593676 RepID=UPI002E788AF8|nr:MULTISPECIES: AMP-binding protein [unclassified Streptomyces]MEE1757780.1 AMP-binding protein [Streptomyces sp. SP18BB07]MEE1836788.1 AMP-binding protein [Streptomyces sp. SP17KL33]